MDFEVNYIVFILVISFLVVCLVILLAVDLTMVFSYKKKKIENEAKLRAEQFNSSLKEIENKNLEAILNALEEERERISKDIHDRIGAGISTAKLYFKGIEKLVENTDQKLDDNFLKVNEVLDNSIAEVRKISHHMSAGILADFGLKTALQELKETVEGSGEVTFGLMVTGINERLPKNIEINLYRIIQELVNNTIKHSGAKAIDLDLSKGGNQLLLKYKDDGTGFILEKISQGMGLRNLESRAKSIGAVAELASNNGFEYKMSLKYPE